MNGVLFMCRKISNELLFVYIKIGMFMYPKYDIPYRSLKCFFNSFLVCR